MTGVGCIWPLNRSLPARSSSAIKPYGEVQQGFSYYEDVLPDATLKA